MTSYMVGRSLLDLAWLIWLFYISTQAIVFSLGAINTRTDYLAQGAKTGFASLLVLAWPILRLWVLS